MNEDDGDRLTIELPGGASIGFAGFGDPAGVPCLAFHAAASSRLMPGWMFAPELLTAAGVRMIGVDRPGYGLSTVPWATGFSDWPRAVGALAGHLGLGRFAVLAHSLASAPKEQPPASAVTVGMAFLRLLSRHSHPASLSRHCTGWPAS